MRKIHIDFPALMAAFEYSSPEISYYLDLETGEVLMVADQTRWHLEAIYEEFFDLDSEDAFDLAKLVAQLGLPDWQQQTLLEADQIEEAYITRYISIPQITSHEGYNDMQSFIPTVKDRQLQEKLWYAISGKGAFKRFKDILLDYPAERQRWFDFKNEMLEKRVVDWLEEMEIESLTDLPSELEVTADTSIRPQLIAETLLFVRNAQQLPGIKRIALIGSLVTNKPDPKDVDLLVTVTDDADLAPLASLARKLQGHMQSLNRGADVFLADPFNNYLGRTCPWKQCRSGLRQSCDALHCGLRPYLHDDLNTIRLATSLVADPPLELWPEIVVRVPLPKDVELQLVNPLRVESVR